MAALGPERHVVIVLGCNKPDHNESFTYAGSSLQKRAAAGISALLALRLQGKEAALVLSGFAGEAIAMQRQAVRELAELSGMEAAVVAAMVHAEIESKSTVENAVCCRDVVPFPASDPATTLGRLGVGVSVHVWLVTALNHMPRSVMLFGMALPAAGNYTIHSLPAYGVGKDYPETNVVQINRDASTYQRKFPEALELSKEKVDALRHQAHADILAQLTGRDFRERYLLAEASEWKAGAPGGDQVLDAGTDFFQLRSCWKRKFQGFHLHLAGPGSVLQVREKGLTFLTVAHRVRFDFLGEPSKTAAAEWALVPVHGHGWCWLVNRYYPNLRVHVQYGQVIAQSGVPDSWSSAMWRRVPSGSGGGGVGGGAGAVGEEPFRLENKWHITSRKPRDHGVLHVQKAGGIEPDVQCGTGEWKHGWSSAKWTSTVE